jgi:methenyltetrahydrofolate cyclohydrolase
VEHYAAAVASGAPTPGSGSVSAMVGSLSVALGEMVCNLTVEGAIPEHTELLESAAAEGSNLRATLLDLASQDEAAYAGFRAASSLPKATDDDKRIRREAMEQALMRAAEVPLDIARTIVATFRVLAVAAEHGTRHALSDVSTGALLGHAAVRAVLLNVDVNAKLMRDQRRAELYRSDSTAVQAEADRRAAEVQGLLAARS